MADFITYRNGKGPIEKRLKDAVAHFYAWRRVVPSVVVVNASELDEAQAAAEALKLAVKVRASGGCLMPEVWLGVGEKVDG